MSIELLLFLFDQLLLLRWSFFPSNLPVPMLDLPTLALPILLLAIPLGSAAPWVFLSFEPANDHQTISSLTVSKTSTARSCKIPAGAVIAIGAKANVTNAEFSCFSLKNCTNVVNHSKAFMMTLILLTCLDPHIFKETLAQHKMYVG
jgi:hypothetical protein